MGLTLLACALGSSGTAEAGSPQNFDAGQAITAQTQSKSRPKLVVKSIQRGKRSLGAPSGKERTPQFYGNCHPEDMPTPMPCSNGSEPEYRRWSFDWSFEHYHFESIQLERQELHGYRQRCSLEINGQTANLSDCSLSSIMPGSIREIDSMEKPVFEALHSAIDELVAKSDKCARTSHGSLASDDLYSAAKQSVQQAHGGQLPGDGTKVDVMYGDGRVYTFTVERVHLSERLLVNPVPVQPGSSSPCTNQG